MTSSKLVVEVHFGGRFDWSFGCVYSGGEVEVHNINVDLDKLSYFETEDICKEYGYRVRDLMYFKDPAKSLADGLHLITSDHDVLFMSACHTGHVILELYIVSFGDGGGDEEDSEDDEYGGRVDLDDPWWTDRLSDTEDLFDVGVDVGTSRGDGGAGSSNVQPDNPRVEQGNEEDNGESSEEGSHDDSEDNVDHTEAGHAGRPVSDWNLKRTFEDVDDDDANSEIGRSDILVSPVASDEEVEKYPMLEGLSSMQLTLGFQPWNLRWNSQIYIHWGRLLGCSIWKGGMTLLLKEMRDKSVLLYVKNQNVIIECMADILMMRIHSR